MKHPSLARWQWGIVAVLAVLLFVLTLDDATEVADVIAQGIVAPIIAYLLVLIPAALSRGVKALVEKVRA